MVNDFLIERFEIERAKKDRSGIYAITQKVLAYNSNKIEGSTLTPNQTSALFDDGYLPATDDYYKAKDVEEMQGHFIMFNKMLDTLDQPLSEDLIKQFHYELKAGVFEDRANGYAIGDYKTRPSVIGVFMTTPPKDVHNKMAELLSWYSHQEFSLGSLAEFHCRYECIHPFQDGNGRTGRLILFRECLVHNIVPLVVKDNQRAKYIKALVNYRDSLDSTEMKNLFIDAQNEYKKLVDCFRIGIYDGEMKIF